MILGALTSFYFYMHGSENNMNFVAILWREALGAKFILPSLASFDLTLVLRIPSVADLMRTFESVEVIEIRLPCEFVVSRSFSRLPFVAALAGPGGVKSVGCGQLPVRDPQTPRLTW